MTAYMTTCVFVDLPNLVRCAIAAGVSASGRTQDDKPYICLAAAQGSLQALKVLLSSGASPAATDALGNIALFEAIMSKFTECARVLLPLSDLGHTNLRGKNALHACVLTANQECFDLVLPLVSDVDARSVRGYNSEGQAMPSFCQTALHLACQRGQHKMVKALLKRGASRTARDFGERTPLHCAAEVGHLSCIILLLGSAAKANAMDREAVDATDGNGRTALHSAAYHGHTPCCGALIAAGASLEATADDGARPLTYVQQRHPAKQELSTLLASGATTSRTPGTVCDSCGEPAVPGKSLKSCTGCYAARYCSVACGQARWPLHREECQQKKAYREYLTRVNLS